MCGTNISVNSLNFIDCGNAATINTVICNSNNVTDNFIVYCDFNDRSCLNYWTGLYNKRNFPCYYYSDAPDTILLDIPNYITMGSVGFIFAFIFLGAAMLLFVSYIITVIMNKWCRTHSARASTGYRTF
jgi:hypothetical protein